MSRRQTATTVGVLFVAQMLTAVFGTSLIKAFTDGDRDRGPLTVGVLLMLCSAVAVVCIGLLMYPVLRDVDGTLAVWYPVMRIAEFAVSTACGIYLLARLEAVPHQLLWIYIPTGLGGLVLTYLLLVSGLVPRPIAVLGLVGYACLTAGVPLELAGVLDTASGAGQVLLVPGGLFEALVLPIWLIARGFGPRPVGTAGSPVLAVSG